MRFNKSHGLGNDFIIVDNRAGELGDLSALARRLCPRAVSVGADTLLVLENSETCAVGMRTINADGTEAAMCGNGIRCFAKYLYERGIVQSEEFDVETLAGAIRPVLHMAGGTVDSVTINMGAASFERERIPMRGDGVFIDMPLQARGAEFTATSLLMTIPHTVLFVDDADAVDTALYGPAIEHNPLYPEGTNVDFVQVLDRRTLKLRSWERGCGATLACGTGACAAVAAGFMTGRCEREVSVRMALGALNIRIDEDWLVYMRGPAVSVYDGEIEL
ncbi:MAG: diaminopimelate epimerase [Clostridia bacterium]|nr:diaminopimelate epimerase [Clostridia bacterium]